MDHWQKRKERHDGLQQQYSLDVQNLMHEAKLNNIPNDVLQTRLDMMQRAFERNVEDMNRAVDRDNQRF